MRYSFDNIAAFLRVVETGSISAAAFKLNLAKSVVSKRINDLKTQLGVELLHRSTRGVVPTDKGVAFHRRVREIMQQLIAAADEITDSGDNLCGQLRITAPMSFGTLCLRPLLFRFLSRHPRLELALNFDDRFVDILGDGYDLAIRIGRLHDSSLIARKLAPSPRIVCCSPDTRTASVCRPRWMNSRTIRVSAMRTSTPVRSGSLSRSARAARYARW